MGVAWPIFISFVIDLAAFFIVSYEARLTLSAIVKTQLTGCFCTSLWSAFLKNKTKNQTETKKENEANKQNKSKTKTQQTPKFYLLTSLPERDK